MSVTELELLWYSTTQRGGSHQGVHCQSWTAQVSFITAEASCELHLGRMNTKARKCVDIDTFLAEGPLPLNDHSSSLRPSDQRRCWCINRTLYDYWKPFLDSVNERTVGSCFASARYVETYRKTCFKVVFCTLIIVCLFGWRRELLIKDFKPGQSGSTWFLASLFEIKFCAWRKIDFTFHFDPVRLF